MRLPAPLSRSNPKVHKNQFGHVLIMAGSPGMLGAAALCGLSAMRSGAGLVTLAVAKGLNLTLQKKISAVLMTLPLAETPRQSISFTADPQIKKMYARIQSMAIGPGLGQDPSTKKLVLKVIKECPPLVIDADALNILSKEKNVLLKAKGPRVLTPHEGEMSRLTGSPRRYIEKNREAVARAFARKYQCVLLLKGHRTVIASPDGKAAINRTGNAGMATAGSGDVLTGMIAAFIGQGMGAFEAAKAACHLHGKAGDLAAKRKGKASMIATDIIESLPAVIREVK
jgi:ADP-dependent NAD(P)H-hydrate dehydratase / NAD(P)H-hydrate epimerase